MSTTQALAQNFENRTTETQLGTTNAKDGGLAWADFNNDGCLDVLVNTNSGQRSRLYMSNCGVNANQADTTIRFTDVTSTHAPGMLNITLERSAVWADFNEDGYLDFVRNDNARLEIYLNKGPMPPAAHAVNAPYSFGDANGNPNTTYTSWSINGTFNTEGVGALDYNLDGHVDLLIDNHNGGVMLLKGDGTGSFTQEPYANTLLPSSNSGAGDYSAVGDIDVDGDIDFLGRKGGPDLWINDAANTTHANGPQFTANAFNQPENNGNKGGVALCDFDNDGDFDIFWTDQGTNQIWLNTNNVFTALPGAVSGINIPGGNNIDSVTCADVDNDGDLDIFLTNSGTDRLYINNGLTNGVPTFTQNNRNITGNADGEGAAFADYDNDGDLDLLINQDGANEFWANTTNNNSYVMLQPVIINGNNTKRPAVGATVTIYNDAGQVIGVRELSGGHGHGTSGTGRIHIGVPDANARYTMEINFPGAGKGVLCNVVPANLPGYNLLEVDASLPDACPVTLDTPADNSLTNDNTPTLSGTTDSGNAVTATIRDNNGNIVQTRTDNTTTNGNWSVNALALPDGTYTVSATTTDDAGNTATDGPHTFTVDTTAPAVDIDAPTNGAVTNDTTPTINGTTEPGAALRVTIRDNNGNVVGMALTPTNNNGNWTIDAPTLADGTYTVEVEATDDAGNTATDGPNTFTVDTTDPTLALNTPANNSVTNDNTPRLSGTTDSGNAVTATIRDNNGNVVQTRTDNTTTSGNWAVNATTLPDGTYTVTATTSDDAGNTATDGPNTFTIDTVAPTVTLNTPANNSITTDTTPTISGTAEAGSTLEVTIRDNNGNVVGMALTPANNNGSWTIDAPALADGTYTVDVQATDDAGNTATDGPNTFTVDTTAPVIAITRPANNSSTNDTTPNISGTTDSGNDVVVTIRDTNGNVVQTRTDTTTTSGNWAVNATTLPEGTYTVTVETQDDAGNTATDGPHTFTIDTTAPAIALNAPADNSTTGDNTPAISGTTDSGNDVTITLTDSNNNSRTLTATPNNNGGYSVDAPALTDGTYTVTVETQDDAGNTATDGPHTFTIDTTAPTLTLDSPADNSASNDNTPTYAGTSDPNTTVTVEVKDNNGNIIETLTPVANNNGDWTVDGMMLADGAYTVEVRTTDNGGNMANAGPNAFTIDTQDPAVTIDTPANNSATNDSTPALTGTTDANNDVALTIRNSNGDVVQTLNTQADANGQYAIDAMALMEGTYTVEATATDAAGNTGSAGPNTFTIDTTAPGLTLNTPADQSISNDTTPTVSGTADAGAMVSISITDSNNNVVATLMATANNNGDWTVDSNALPEGTYTVSATTSDAAGNVATDGPNTFTIDATAPSVVLDTPADQSVTNDDTPTISGTAEAGSTLAVTIRDNNGNVVGMVLTPTNNNGSWTIDAPALADGTYTVEVQATDGAGNTVTDGPHTFSVDLTDPTVTITAPADNATISNVRPTLEGNTEPSATVDVTLKDAAGNVVLTQTVQADAQSGSWQVNNLGMDLVDGDYTIEATATDLAGNTANTTSSFTVDTTALPLDVATPVSGSATSQTQPAITGTTAPNTSVTVVVEDAQGVVETLMTTSDAQGNWSVTPTMMLADGPYTATAEVTNAAGTTTTDNTSFTVDTMAPVLTLDAPADGEQTNDNTPTVTGTSDPGTEVTVTIKDNNGDVIETLTVTTNPMGNYSVDVSQLPDGPYTVEAQVSDAAGNMATAGPNAFTVDTVAPVVDITAPADNTILATRDVQVDGTTDPNQDVVVEVFDANGISQGTQTVTADAQGNWTTTFTGLPNGAYTANAQVSDAAGNTAADMTSFSVDSTEATITITQPANDTATSNPQPDIAGSTDPDATVTVVIKDQAGNTVATLTPSVDPQTGMWTIRPDMPLADDQYTIEATATRPNGAMATTSVTVDVDTTAPTTTIDQPAAGTTTTDQTPDITGTTEPGATVVVTVKDDQGMTVFEDTVTADDQGNWSTTPTMMLPEGSFTVEATSTDKAGNSDTVGPQDFTIDTSAPVITITSPAPGDELTDPTPTITGTAEPGETVKIFIDGEEVGETTADDQGNWSFDVPVDKALDDGEHTIEARTTTDPVVTSGPVTVTVKQSGSSVTITSPTDGTVITEPEVTVTGTGTPGEEITVTANGESKTVTVGEDGTWMTTFDNLPEGDNTITAKAGDDEVTVTVTVNTDSREFILLGNGCSSTNGQPTDMLWLLVIGFVLGLCRRRQR